MKIYTYYDNINFFNQKELIGLWEKSWNNNGFETIVLSKEDAKKHEYYDEFVYELNRMHNTIKNKPLAEYGLSCYLRWLAYSNQNDELFYTSDYDVINLSLKPEQPIEDIHFMDRYCPCFVSGRPKYFEKFCRDIVSVTDTNIRILKKKSDSMYWYHDQEFLDQNKEYVHNNYSISMDYENLWNNKIKHFSRHYVYGKITNRDETDKYRLILIKEFLNENK
jgi:hypothetical protein